MTGNGNDTPNTPDLSETELREMKMAELREVARDAGVAGRSSMKKDELVSAISQAAGAGGRRGGGEGSSAEREVTQSEDTRYSQVIESVDDEPERDGRSLVTTDHEVIRRWAEARGGVPATVPGTEHDDHLGVLRFDFPGGGGNNLEHVSWEEWFRTFDERNLNFLYQEKRSDGHDSNFFRLENPERSDA
jgi:hypothetical protein